MSDTPKNGAASDGAPPAETPNITEPTPADTIPTRVYDISLEDSSIPNKNQVMSAGGLETDPISDQNPLDDIEFGLAVAKGINDIDWNKLYELFKAIVAEEFKNASEGHVAIEPGNIRRQFLPLIEAEARTAIHKAVQQAVEKSVHDYNAITVNKIRQLLPTIKLDINKLNVQAIPLIEKVAKEAMDAMEEIVQGTIRKSVLDTINDSFMKEGIQQFKNECRSPTDGETS